MEKDLYKTALGISSKINYWSTISSKGESPMVLVLKALEEQKSDERTMIKALLEDIKASLDMSRRRVRPDEVVKLINDKTFEHYGYDAILSA